MKRIITLGLIGWTAIVALAWWLADRRIGACRYDSGGACELRATAARDIVLTGGLTVALVALLLVGTAAELIRRRRGNIEQGIVVPKPPRLRSLPKALSMAWEGQRGRWSRVAILATAAFALGWLAAVVTTNSDPAASDDPYTAIARDAAAQASDLAREGAETGSDVAADGGSSDGEFDGE